MLELWGILCNSSLPSLKEYTGWISAAGKDYTNEFLGYDTKQSNGEALVMLELWGMQNTPSLPSISNPLRPGMVAPDKVLSMGQRELWHSNSQTNDLSKIELLEIELFNHLTMCKQMTNV